MYSFFLRFVYWFIQEIAFSVFSDYDLIAISPMYSYRTQFSEILTDPIRHHKSSQIKYLSKKKRLGKLCRAQRKAARSESRDDVKASNRPD